MRRALVRTGVKTELATKRILLAAARRARDAYKGAYDEITRIADVDPGSSFSGIPVEAVERMFIKREMGLVRTYKSLQPYNANLIANEIDALLQKSVAEGLPTREFASRLAKAIIEQDEHAKAAVERFGHGPQLARWARQAKDSPTRDEVKIASKVGYNARRIARSEPAQAYHEASAIVC